MKKETKLKILKRLPAALHIINFILVMGFLVYIYFWIKGRS